jgi:hypothetical protein
MDNTIINGSRGPQRHIRKPSARARFAAASALVAAGAMAASAVGYAAPANANVDWYGSLAYSLGSNVGGKSENMSDAETARLFSLNNCQG